MSAMAADVPAAAHPAVDEVFSSALLLTEIMRPLGLQDLLYCSAVGPLWLEQAAAAVRKYTAREAPALAAALHGCNLPPAACLAVACRAVESLLVGKQLRNEDRAAALADYALVVTVHDSAGDACFGGVLPLLPAPPFMCEVTARGDATQPVRAVSLPPLPLLPRYPLSLSVQGSCHTGARDVRDLRVSVDVVRHSTAQVARLWYSEPPAAGQELCSYAEHGWPTVPHSLNTFLRQLLTFGLNFDTVTQTEAQEAADANASGRPGVLPLSMREPKGVMCRMGLELRPEQADGQPALFAPMQCLEGAARLLNWYSLVPPLMN